VRLATAVAVIAVALSTAVYVHQRHVWTSTVTSVQSKSGDGAVTGRDTFARVSHRPAWEDPAAVLIAIGGLAVAARLVAFRPRFTEPS